MIEAPSPVDLCIRLLPGRAIAKPGDDFKDSAGALSFAARLERGINARVDRSSSVLGQYADHRIRLALEENRLAKNAPVPGNDAAPESIAENRRLGSVRTVFIV